MRHEEQADVPSLRKVVGASMAGTEALFGRVARLSGDRNIAGS